MIRELIDAILPDDLRSSVRGLNDEAIALYCRELGFELDPNHREFVSIAGASDPDVLSDVYDFRFAGLSASPFVPVFRGFFCIAYQTYPDSASLYLDVEGSPRAGIFSLLDEVLSASTHAEIVRTTPAYTSFSSAFGEAFFIRHLIDRNARTPACSRRNEKDVSAAVKIATQLGMTPLLEEPDVAIFTREGTFVLATVHLAARLLHVQFAGADPIGRRRVLETFEDGLA